MIETTLVILLFLTFAYYLAFLWRVWLGLGRTVLPSTTSTPRVSVIVAARNEERTIEQCLHALVHQDYDAKLFDIIVVDDHSSDRTSLVAREYSQRNPQPRIHLLSLKGALDTYGKPAAIARGVEAATGEIILCTDADCVVPQGWIRSMAGCFGSSVAFVAGPVIERRHEGLLTRLESLEFLGLLTTAAGLIGSKAPIICNGANIAYRKKSFEDVGGYGDGSTSCDDETLMQRMILRKVGDVVFNADPLATVSTSTPASAREFWNQRTRWAAKRGRYESAMILARLLGLYFFFVTLLVTSLSAIALPSFGPSVLAVFLLKGIFEYMVLRSGSRLFSYDFGLSDFLIAELLHVPYIVFAAAIGQLQSMSWKGRTLHR
jgi:cellulose synthase/poly-beta-1,6-N-acetylglucosamine synthase-like glycosyltransferase